MSEQSRCLTSDVNGTQPAAPAQGEAARAAAPRTWMGPDVSVCIVNWNCQVLLRECLESLQQTRDVSLEIIVVDNGSSDGAPEMVARDFPEVILVRNPDNRSFAAANNQAARQACGRYLFFLNNDTRIPAGALASLLAYAQAHPHVGLIGPCLRDAQGQVQISARLRPTLGVLLHRVQWLRWTGLFRRGYHRYRCRSSQPSTPAPVEVLMGAALFVPWEVYQAIGGWDEDYRFGGEDIDLCTRIGQRWPIVYHPGVSITHHGRISSRQRSSYAYGNTMIGLVRYLRKNGCSPTGIWLYKLALTIDAPLQCLAHAGELVRRRLLSQHELAAKSRLALRATNHFLLHDLGRLWGV